MMFLIISSLILSITPWMINTKLLWSSSILKSLMIIIFSINIINNHSYSIWHKISLMFATDSISSPLIILSIWLVPISLMASIKTMSNNSIILQQTFISLTFIILLALILTFSSMELSLFYMAFETTLLPTLVIISRWGIQKERFQASMYFLFYTLIGSLPLLMAMMTIYNNSNTIILPSNYLVNPLSNFSTYSLKFWWMFCILAFIIKMPIYGFHLWLPKAHVEAPIAGSMILAAILLKLGGYGLIRTMSIFSIPSSNFLSLPIMTFCIWGTLITSIICLRQTDLKALMAYSSVGHMSLVAAGMFSLSLWGTKGALTLMIAHGLISSSLFCLANIFYERNNSRTLAITRGFKLMSPLISMWWIFSCICKFGLPPSPKLIGELFIISTIIDWKILTSPLIGISTIFSMMYSLLIFQNTKKFTFPKFLTNISNMPSSSHILLLFHLFPLLFFTINPSLILMN